MVSRIKQTGDAIVALIEQGEAAGEFSFELQTEFKYEFSSKLANEDGLVYCNVVWAPGEFRQESRSTFVDDLKFDIVIRRKFSVTEIQNGAVANNTIDLYVEQLEQINDWLATPGYHRLPTCTSACWIAPGRRIDGVSTNDLGILMPLNPEHLNDWNQYTGILRVMYRWGLQHTE